MNGNFMDEFKQLHVKLLTLRNKEVIKEFLKTYNCFIKIHDKIRNVEYLYFINEIIMVFYNDKKIRSWLLNFTLEKIIISFLDRLDVNDYQLSEKYNLLYSSKAQPIEVDLEEIKNKLFQILELQLEKNTNDDLIIMLETLRIKLFKTSCDISHNLENCVNTKLVKTYYHNHKKYQNIKILVKDKSNLNLSASSYKFNQICDKSKISQQDSLVKPKINSSYCETIEKKTKKINNSISYSQFLYLLYFIEENDIECIERNENFNGYFEDNFLIKGLLEFKNCKFYNSKKILEETLLKHEDDHKTMAIGIFFLIFCHLFLSEYFEAKFYVYKALLSKNRHFRNEFISFLRILNLLDVFAGNYTFYIDDRLKNFFKRKLSKSFNSITTKKIESTYENSYLSQETEKVNLKSIVLKKYNISNVNKSCLLFNNKYALNHLLCPVNGFINQFRLYNFREKFIIHNDKINEVFNKFSDFLFISIDIHSVFKITLLNHGITLLYDHIDFKEFLGRLQAIIIQSNITLKMTVRTNEEIKSWWIKRIKLDNDLKSILTKLNKSLIQKVPFIYFETLNDGRNNEEKKYPKEKEAPSICISKYLKSYKKLFLILDETITNFPFESLEAFKHLHIYRVPSMEFLLETMKCKRILRPKSIGYIIDPENNLIHTRNTFTNFFKKIESESNLKNLDWHKVYEIEKNEEKMANVRESDIFMYFGHGTGRKYFKRNNNDLRKRNIQNICCIFGCSSSKVQGIRNFQRNGAVLEYLKASRVYVGCLWDVTDKDLDKFTVNFLEYLFKIKNYKNTKESNKDYKLQNIKNDLSSFMEISKENLKLKYLNGSAIVLWGVPTIVEFG